MPYEAKDLDRATIATALNHLAEELNDALARIDVIEHQQAGRKARISETDTTQ